MWTVVPLIVVFEWFVGVVLVMTGEVEDVIVEFDVESSLLLLSEEMWWEFWGPPQSVKLFQ